MNAVSSRSHAVFTVQVRMAAGAVESRAHLNFVDLAGSERQKKTGATGFLLRHESFLLRHGGSLETMMSILLVSCEISSVDCVLRYQWHLSAL